MKKIFTRFNWVRIYAFLLGVGFLPILGWGQNLINESFSSSLPSGWTSVGSPIFNSTTACAGNSLGFNGSGDGAITPLLTKPNKLDFNLKRSSNTTAWEMKVQRSTSTSGPWTDITTLSTITANCDAQTQIDLSSFTDIYIRFIDTRASGTHERSVDDVVVSTAEPTTQSSLLNFTSVTPSSMSLNWTNGNGTRRAVFMRESTVGTITSPTDGTLYTASSNWSSKGTQLGTSGYYCVYDGTGSTVGLTNLTANTTYYLQIFEYNSNSTPTATTINYFTGGTAATGNQTTSVGTSNISNIIRNTSFTEPTNIAYGTYQQTTGLTTDNSLEVAQFDIQDGGGTTDADALSTTLTGLTLTVANSSNIRRIALFDGSTNVGEVAAGATATFSSLTLAAADGGSKTFSVRVSFKSTVTDNQQFSFTVNSATANPSGSTFAAANAGAAASSTTGNSNKIVVTATDLIFNINPSNVAINAIMSPSPTVLAVDANVNTDLDFVGTVTLTTTGTFGGGATTSVSAVSGTATFSNLTFSVSGTGLTIAGSATGVNATGNSTTFNVLAAASQLAFGTSPPASGNVGVNLTSFTVEARRPDNSVDNTFTGNIAISKASGTGTLSGTLTVAAVAGVATFSTLQLSAADTYTLTASASGLTDITSGNIVVSVANATAILWSSSGGSAWLSTGNWTGSAVPTSTQVAQFGANPTATSVNINGGASPTGAIEVTSTRASTALTIGNNSGSASNGTLTLSGVVVNGMANVIMRNNSSGLLTIQNLGSTGSASNTMDIALGNTTNNNIYIDGTGGITISSIISGSGKNLTKAGAGTGILTLSGANTFSGTFTASTGTTKLSANSALGSVSSIDISNAAKLQTGITTLTDVINNSASVNIAGTGILDLSGGSETVGSLASASSTASVVIGDFSSTAGSFTVGDATNTTFAGIISGSRATAGSIFTKQGAGTLTLTGANTYTTTLATGLTTVTAGTLKLNRTGGTTIPVGSNVSVTGGILQISSNQTLNNLTVNGGGVTVDDGVTLTINGTLTLTSGKITLGTGNVVAAAISGGSSSSYVITTGTGKLTVNAVGIVTFPVGPTASAYNPVTITSGVGVNYAVNVSSTAPSGTGITQPTKVINRQWDITPNTNVSNVGLAFHYNTGEGASAFVEGNSMDGIHFNSTLSKWDPIGTATPVNSGSYTVSFSYAGPTWSPFSFGNSGVLPTELTNLTAKSVNGQNLLTWQTISEKNNAYFDIQHATDAKTFQTIGQVKGNGTTNEKQSYSFEHTTPSVGINYYRLRQVDFDSKETLSNVVSVVNNSKGGKLKVYPTIAQDKLTISLDSNEPQTFNIYNLLGQNVQTGQLSGQKDLNINTLSTGTYLLKVNGETVRFVKN